MDRGAMPSPDRESPARTDVLHASERTRVTRLFLPGRTVIRKEPLGADAQRRLQHEAAILERLRGAAGVAQLADTRGYAGSILLVDVGATSLVERPTPVPVDELIELALHLARAVAGMHRRGVMHRDIAPANIVVSRDGAPCLVDFALATSSGEARPDFTHHTEIVGTLAYLAPEQTGRTGRSVDERADLYALGAVLYELATGDPPFGSGDPLRLVHDHLARVPVPPSQANPAIPPAVSAVVMHLLEKEPDNRYQSADGLVRDLEQLRDAPAGAADAPFRVGERDVPLRLLPPSRPVAREAEIATLRAAFEEALAGRCRGLLISGAPGVGKTVLANEVRPEAASRGGWFVSGKFDQHRRDLEFDASHQALRALARVVLAEPEAVLARARERILAAVGSNAGLLAAVVPELAVLLAVPPDAGDPLTAQVRLARAALGVLRAIASSQRPVVVFMDDLQWAGRTPLALVDLVLGDEEPIDGLLLIGAYRDDDVDAAHPLAGPLSRSREQPDVRHLRLDNLPVPGVVDMVADILHADRAVAARLVKLIGPWAPGNPYEIVELLNALRREDVLTPTADGWHWDEGAARAHLASSEIEGLLAARVAGIGPESRHIVEAMACLGGRAELSLLAAATGDPANAVEEALAPALDEGLLVVEPGTRDAVRFRHDRIHEAVLHALDPQRRRTLRLAVARRLASAPELFAVAAEQYLPVVDAIDALAERRTVVGLLRRAADQAALIGDYARVDALLAGALCLVDPAESATVVELRTGRHAALYGLGRLNDADEEYRAIERLRPVARARIDATAVQVRSLTHRTRYAEAVTLGLESLRACGIAVPVAGGFADELDSAFDRLHRWLERTELADDLARPALSDPRLLAASRLIDAVLPTAYFVADPGMIAWLALAALRIWIEHGPGPTLVGPAGHAAYHAAAQRGEHAAAYRALRRIVALGEARGYEPGTSQARHMLAALSCWFEPIEIGLHEARRAREGLVAGADLAYAGYTYQLAVPYLVDCAPSLDGFAAEVDGGLAFLRRTGNEQTGRWLDSYQWLAGVLRGDASPEAGDAVPIDGYAEDPLALLYAHVCRALAAAIFDDAVSLAQHSAAATQLIAAAAGSYATAVIHVLRALALAGQVRAADGGERDTLLSELDELPRWLAPRAADAPDNFLHLLRLVEAERAWAVGDFPAAALAFDAARREVAARRRPWHAALIAERAARFHLAHGLEQAGHDLLVDARRQYLAWSATAKVDQLDRAYPMLRPHPDAALGHGNDPPADLAHRRSTLATGTLDLLGVLSASQALSSETSVERLHGRVAEVLGAMTGATAVHLALRSDERDEWLLPAQAGAGGAIAVAASGDEAALPHSVLRYVQRTREPLVVSDATRDDRFARDPYFVDLVGCCSLLAVPIVSRGALRAVLVLENRLIRDAFTTERLDAVKLIASQLAVSLDNAQLYADYRRVADEQAALRRVATLVAQGGPPTTVLDAVAAEIERLLDADGVTLARYEPGAEITVFAHRGFETWQLPAGARFAHDGESVTAAVRRTGRPARMEDYRTARGPFAEVVRDLGVRASIGTPITVEGRLWGVAVVYWTREESLPAGTEERIAQFAQLLETAIANADGRDQLIASRARLLAAGDEARRRVVRDLHDGAQQQLVRAIVTLKLAQQALRDDPASVEELIRDALEAAEHGHEDLRELARGMLPTALTRGGLSAAIAAMVERLGVPVDLDVADERFPVQIEASAYFIVAEALTNVVKHAQATRAEVRTSVGDGVLRVEVCDDGIGGADPRSHGLVGMSDRVAALGGHLTIESPPGAGTVVVATLPIGVATSRP